MYHITLFFSHRFVIIQIPSPTLSSDKTQGGVNIVNRRITTMFKEETGCSRQNIQTYYSREETQRTENITTLDT